MCLILLLRLPIMVESIPISVVQDLMQREIDVTLDVMSIAGVVVQVMLLLLNGRVMEK